MPVQCTCRQCGASFFTQPHRIAAGKGKYCSARCSNAGRRHKAEHPCAQCGQPFHRSPSMIATGTKHCSWACRVAAAPAPSAFVCENCGARFAVTPHLADGRRYCSRACYDVARRRDAVSLFWGHVDTSGPCWFWTGRTDINGYGLYRISNHPSRYVRAYRFAWQLAAGPIPDGMMIGHVCDAPGCVRNDDEGVYAVNGVLRPRRGHLWIGTQADNMVDMSRKGRSTRKLGAEAIADIVSSYAPNGDGGMSKGALARKYQTNQGVIARILRTHLPASK